MKSLWLEKKGSERLPQVEVDLEKADEEGANDSLNGKIYLEFNTKQLTFEEQDAVAGKMDLLDGFNEIYTDFGEGDCSDGTVLDKGLFRTKIQSFNYNAQKNYPAKKQNECFPQGNEGKVVELRFKIKDYTDVQKTTVVDVDTIEFCVRVGYVKEINNEDDDVVISYIDTKITGTIDVTGGFNTFTQNVDVEKTDATEFDTEVQKSVPIVTSVCKKNYENVNVDRTYVNGQNFRICVVSEDITAYEVVDFKSLSCGDGEFERNLYDESKLNNGITNFSGIDEKTKKMAMKSVLTSGLVAQGIKSGSGMVLCRGEVSLKNVAGRRSRGRNLQEEASVEGESLTTPFEMNINLDTPATNDNNNIESSAPLPSSITTTTVAVIGFGSILSFVFSMIL